MCYNKIIVGWGTWRDGENGMVGMVKSIVITIEVYLIIYGISLRIYEWWFYIMLCIFVYW